MYNMLNGAVGLAALLAASIATAAPAMAQKVFPSAQAAADDLVAAAKAGRAGFVAELFGPRGRQLVSTGDAEQDKQNLAQFVEAVSTRFKLEDKDANTKLLVIGEREFPFPIPIMKQGDGWAFDPVAGQREIRARVIGHNELAAMSACAAYMGAQKDYIRNDRDGDSVFEYAQRIISSPGRKDGLYWEPESQSDISPLEGALADAVRAALTGARTYEGYVFRILRAQGPAAPGGAYHYVINGNMIGGFALVAWPAEYGNSGIMTFLVNQQGRVYQSDLGPRTAKTAAALQAYDLGANWSVSPD